MSTRLHKTFPNKADISLLLLLPPPPLLLHRFSITCPLCSLLVKMRLYTQTCGFSGWRQ